MIIYKTICFYMGLLCLIGCIYSCSSDENGFDVQNDIELKSEVINTYRQNLGLNIDSIQEITLKHPLIKQISDSIPFDYKSNNSAAIYFYSNNLEALVLEDVTKSDANEIYIYAYLFNSDHKQLKDIIYTNFVVSEIRSTNKRISATMTSLMTNTIITQYDSFNRASWGECMSDGIDLLYNDWSSDPGGTLSCWLTGYWCVVGGAIGCTIQSW